MTLQFRKLHNSILKLITVAFHLGYIYKFLGAENATATNTLKHYTVPAKTEKS
jgi:hypothetical protein